MVDGLDIDRGRLAWWTIGLALGGAVLYVVYSFVGTFVFGIFIYYATRPVYERLRRRIAPASLAAATALFALALPVLLLTVYTGAIALQEFNNIATQTNVEGLQSAIQPYVDVSSIARGPNELLASQDPSLLRDVSRSALAYVGLLGKGVLHLFVMIAIAFYLLRDDHRLSRFFRRQFTDESGVVETYITAVDQDLNSVFFGNILNALITGTIGAAAYNTLNLFGPPELLVPYPTLLGLLTGAASLIPIVGMKLVYFPMAIYLALESALVDPGLLWFPALFFAVSLVVVDTIPDLVLRPYVSGRNLHVGLVMLAYIFGPLLFGWYGIFLGPMILVFVVHFVRIVLPELIAGEPIKPWAVDPTYILEPEPPEPSPDGEATSDESPDEVRETDTEESIDSEPVDDAHASSEGDDS